MKNILSAEEKEEFAQELIEAAKVLCVTARKIRDKLTFCENFELTESVKKDIDSATGLEVEDISLAFRGLAMSLDRAALVKSMKEE